MAAPRHVHEVAAVHATTLLWTVSVRVQFEKRVITNGVAVNAIDNSSDSVEQDPPYGSFENCFWDCTKCISHIDLLIIIRQGKVPRTISHGIYEFVVPLCTGTKTYSKNFFVTVWESFFCF